MEPTSSGETATPETTETTALETTVPETTVPEKQVATPDKPILHDGGRGGFSRIPRCEKARKRA